MVTALLFAGLCGAYGSYLLVTRFAVRPYLVTLVWAAPASIGLIRIGGAGGVSNTNAAVVVLSSFGMVLGYIAAGLAVRTRLATLQPRGERRQLPINPGAVATVFCVLAAYHFSRVGFAAFQNDTARARWDFAASGFFGLPGRCFQIGLPLAAILGIKTRTRRGLPPPSVYVALLLGWSLLSLLAGFKSGLVYGGAVLLIVLWQPSWEASARQRSRLLTRVALCGVVAVVGALVLLAVSNIGGPGNRAPNQVLWDRVTLVPAESAASALAQIEKDRYFGTRPTYATELVITLKRTLPVLAGDPRFVFEEWASGYQFRRLGAYQFRVPVTPTGVVTAIYNFGLLTPLLFLGLGFAYRCLELRSAKSGRGLSRVIATIGLLGLHDFVTKGGIAYFIVNWSLMFGLAVAISGLAAIARPRSRRQQASPGFAPLGGQA